MFRINLTCRSNWIHQLYICKQTTSWTLFSRRNHINSFQHHIINLSPPNIEVIDMHEAVCYYRSKRRYFPLLILDITTLVDTQVLYFILGNRVKMKVGQLQIGIGLSFTSRSPCHLRCTLLMPSLSFTVHIYRNFLAILWIKLPQ